MTETDWDNAVAALQAWKAGADFDTAVVAVSARWKQSPWAVLASTIVSLRTKDEVTLARSKALLEKAPGPTETLALGADEIGRLIYPAGFYRTKAANLVKIAQILMDNYNGAVPDDMDSLLALPGVGRKTANLVLIEAFNKDGICVDTHVHKISNRAGWVATKTPDQTEFALRETLPKRHWKPLNDLLVSYGQRVCKPISPLCSQCVITRWCKRVGVDKSR
jgi:endonuclease-3